MGKRTQNFIMLLLLIWITGGLIPQASAQTNQMASGPDQSCEEMRHERQQICDEAARHCIEVYQYDAFNKIMTCADFSQRCSQAGREESELCATLESSQISSRGPQANRVANPGKTL